MCDGTGGLKRNGVNSFLLVVATVLSLILCQNGYALSDEKIVGVWEADMANGTHVAIDFMPAHRATFLLVRSEIFPDWQVKDETIVLSFPEDKRCTSPSRLVVMGMDVDGLRFLRSGLMEDMPVEMEQVRLRRSGRHIRTVEQAYGGMYYDLKGKELPQNLSGEFIETLARLWQFDMESLATVVALPNAMPKTLLWASGLLPKQQWRGEQRQLALAIAGNAHTPEEILKNAWDTWNEPRYWRALAYNPAISDRYQEAYIDRVLAGSDRIRADAAEDPATPADLMERLARDKSGHVVRQLAFNKRAPSAVITILASNPDEDVRRAAALHPNITAETMVRLAHDDHPYVLRDLLLNPKIADEARVEAVARLSTASQEDLRVEAAKRVDADSESYMVLLTDYSPKVRMALAGNPAMPVADLLRLIDDDFLLVRQEAMNRLASQAAPVPQEISSRLRPEEELRQSLDMKSELLEAVRNNDLVYIKWAAGIPEYQPLFGDMAGVLKLALETDNLAVVDYLSDNHKTGQALVDAIVGADHLDPATLKHLIGDGLVQKEMHFRLMSDCVEKSRSLLLEHLIALGLDPRTKGPNGVTLLHVAAEKNNLEMVDYLVKKGVPLSEEDDQKRTPADIAAMNYFIILLNKLDKPGKYERLVENYRKEFNAPARFALPWDMGKTQGGVWFRGADAGGRRDRRTFARHRHGSRRMETDRRRGSGILASTWGA